MLQQIQHKHLTTEQSAIDIAPDVIRLLNGLTGLQWTNCVPKFFDATGYKSVDHWRIVFETTHMGYLITVVYGCAAKDGEAIFRFNTYDLTDNRISTFFWHRDFNEGIEILMSKQQFQPKDTFSKALDCNVEDQ